MKRGDGPTAGLSPNPCDAGVLSGNLLIPSATSASTIAFVLRLIFCALLRLWRMPVTTMSTLPGVA